ncbi:MAG: hypothetical protein V1728_01710, partial [Candidatus Micrarchaeota archaeon]
MPLEDLLISTGVDNLIKLVYEKGSVEVKEAARALRLPQQTIEDWAHVLEAEGVIKIEYRLTQIYLKWAYLDPVEYAKTSEKVQDRKADTVSKLEELNRTLDSGLEGIDHLKEGVNALDMQNHAQLERVSTDRQEVERLHATLEDTVQTKRARIDEMKAEMGQLGREMDALSQALGAAPQGEADGDVGRKIGALAQLQARLEAKISAHEAKSAQIEEQMRAMRASGGPDRGGAEMEALKNGIVELKFSKAELTKAMQSIMAEVKSLDGQVEGIEAHLAQIAKKDGAGAGQKKTMDRLELMVKESLKERTEAARSMHADLEIVQKQIEALSHAQYQFQNIQAHLGSLQSQFQHENEDIERLSGDVENAQSKYVDDLDTARRNLEEQEGKYQELERKSQTIRDVLGRLERLKDEGEALSGRLKGILKEAQVVRMAAPMQAGTDGNTPAANTVSRRAAISPASRYPPGASASGLP